MKELSLQEIKQHELEIAGIKILENAADLNLSSFISRFPWLTIISCLYTSIKFINRIYDVDCYL